ncbi:Centrosomal protein C10orf90, partial [Chaetura pelagica]
QESLSSQSTKLISRIVLSQMIDENQSKENGSALPVQPMVPQPRACHVKQSLANHASVNLDRAVLVLPSRLEVQASLDDTTSLSDSPIAEEKWCQEQQKGFASITVTARRVAVGSSDPARGAGALQEPSVVSPTSSKVPAAFHHCCALGQANQSASELKIPESCSQGGREPQKQHFDPGNKENGPQSSDGREKVPPSFISRVHLQVSQQCPSTIYYLDKSLNLCIEQPRIKRQKIHRSALSLTINCSSSRLTADGVDGIANGEPTEEIFQTKLLGENKTPLRSNLSADLTEDAVNKDKTLEGCLGTEYPWQSVFISELPAFVDKPRGPKSPVIAKQDEDKQPGSSHTTSSLQLPNSSDEAELVFSFFTGTQMLLGGKKQQCPPGRSSATASGSLPDAASRKATAGTGGSSRDPSTSKEIQVQGILKPKVSVSSSMCNIKTSSGIPSEENVHRQNQLLKSDYEFCGSGDKRKDHKEEAEQEGASRVTLSTTGLPDGSWEQNTIFTWPETSPKPEQEPPAPWTLREALEALKPEFISRSRERLKRLEQMVQLRKARQSDGPTSHPGAPGRRVSSTSPWSKKRQYTIPHPLSDNLFKPKERFIPEKEMHMRSKRIYDNLPEVKKKQAEKQKRIIIQSNRLRVEMFKKQLLDQLLQRNTE